VALGLFLAGLGIRRNRYEVRIVLAFAAAAGLNMGLLELRGDLHWVNDSQFTWLSRLIYNCAGVVLALYLLPGEERKTTSDVVPDSSAGRVEPDVRGIPRKKMISTLVVVGAMLGLLAVLWALVPPLNALLRGPKEWGPGSSTANVDAFRALTDPKEEAYLRNNLPADEFRRLQKERIQLARECVRDIAGNALHLICIGETARHIVRIPRLRVPVRNWSI